MKKADVKLLEKLNYHYNAFDKSKISPDPLEFLHRYNNYFDIEISGIISSTFAFGNIKQIMTILEKLHKIMGVSPYKFILKFDREKHAKKFVNIYHRFYSSNDIIAFFETLRDVYITYGSLRYLFILYFFEKDVSLKSAISFFCENLSNILSKHSEVTIGTKFMFPSPNKGSACKRMNLFLRWMIRKDELDFGLWDEISPSLLFIPIDTHIAKISKELKLTSKKIVNWGMVEEITNNLKKYDANDPIKYDFALCHLGMRKEQF